MALATYSDLKTSIANFAGRTDLTSLIPDFIALAHAQINRDLRDHPRMQKRDPNFSVSAEYVALPQDFSEIRSMYLNSGGTARAELSMQYDNWVASETSAEPRYVTVVGSQGAQDREMLRFGPPPDSTYVYTLEYIAKLPALTNSNDHNWVLDNHPDAYLYGALVALATYLKDADAASGYSAVYGNAMGEILKAAHRTRSFGPPMRAQPG